MPLIDQIFHYILLLFTGAAVICGFILIMGSVVAYINFKQPEPDQKLVLIASLLFGCILLSVGLNLLIIP